MHLKCGQSGNSKYTYNQASEAIKTAEDKKKCLCKCQSCGAEYKTVTTKCRACGETIL